MLVFPKLLKLIYLPELKHLIFDTVRSKGLNPAFTEAKVGRPKISPQVLHISSEELHLGSPVTSAAEYETSNIYGGDNTAS